MSVNERRAKKLKLPLNSPWIDTKLQHKGFTLSSGNIKWIIKRKAVSHKVWQLWTKHTKFIRLIRVEYIYIVSPLRIVFCWTYFHLAQSLKLFQMCTFHTAQKRKLFFPQIQKSGSCNNSYIFSSFKSHFNSDIRLKPNSLGDVGLIKPKVSITANQNWCAKCN